MIHRSKSATLLGHDHSQHFKQAAKKSLSDAVQKKLDQEQAQFSTPIKPLKLINTITTIKPVEQEKNLIVSKTQPKSKKPNKKSSQELSSLEESKKKACSICSQTSLLSEQKRVRKRWLFEKTPLYLPNKKVKKTKTFFQEKMFVLDKKLNQKIEFRLFKDSDLGIGKLFQNTLKESTIDDDCQTDSEQLALAQNYVKKQLREAIDHQAESLEISFASYEVSQSSHLTNQTDESISQYLPSQSEDPTSFESFGFIKRKLSFSE
mgnify:CR=1 FL=1|jgi:hypothetical protein